MVIGISVVELSDLQSDQLLLLYHMDYLVINFSFLYNQFFVSVSIDF